MNVERANVGYHGTSLMQLSVKVVKLYLPSRMLISKNMFLLCEPHTKHSWDRAFSIGAPLLWSALSADIKHSPSLAHFKGSLKTHLKGLAMIFTDQENTYFIFRSKEINIYFKTNNKIPVNLLK